MSEFQKRLEANIRESLRFAVGEVDEEAVAHMVAGINAVLDHPSAPPQEQMMGDPKPFMHGIMQPDGTAYMDEICVDISSDTLEELIEEHEMEGYKVVPLYLHPPAPSRNIDDMRKAAWELVKKNGWDATARLSLHQTTELMAALAVTTEGQP